MFRATYFFTSVCVFAHESLGLFYDWFSGILELSFYKCQNGFLIIDLLEELVERIDRMSYCYVAAFGGRFAAALVFRLLDF